MLCRSSTRRPQGPQETRRDLPRCFRLLGLRAVETKIVEVLFSPSEWRALRGMPASGGGCVVLDILRATTSMVTALEHGATAIFPAAEVREALELRARHPDAVLAGERNGVRIGREVTGSIDFDLGNSPREFTRQAVEGRAIIMTTTNGTRALRACSSAGSVAIASFLNLRATAQYLLETEWPSLTVVCAGTGEEAACEDALAAGALIELLANGQKLEPLSDSAQLALQVYLSARTDLAGAMGLGRNGRRLLSDPALRADVPECCARDTTGLVAIMSGDAIVRA